MAFYNKEKRPSFGGPKSFDKRGPKERDFGGGGRGGFGGARDGGRPNLYQATCSECGKDCQLPFRPNGRKPVFCSTCFGKQPPTNSDRGGDRNFGGRDGGRPAFGGNRPQRDFGGSNRAANQTTENFKEQFELLHAKLDRVMDMLARTSAPKKAKAEDDAMDFGDEDEVVTKAKKERKPLIAIAAKVKKPRKKK